MNHNIYNETKMTELEKIKQTLKNLSVSNSEMLNFLFDYENKRLQRWENWLQMQILFELNKEGVEDLWFEERLDNDMRIKLSNEKAGKLTSSIDVVYRRKGTSQKSYNAIELKVANIASHSIRGSLVDLDRTLALKSWYFRSIFSISVFKEDKSKSKFLKLANNFGHIENFGPYRAAIFGWEAKSLELSTRKSYKKWLLELRDECKKYDINLSRSKNTLLK